MEAYSLSALQTKLQARIALLERKTVEHRKAVINEHRHSEIVSRGRLRGIERRLASSVISLRKFQQVEANQIKALQARQARRSEIPKIFEKVRKKDALHEISDQKVNKLVAIVEQRLRVLDVREALKARGCEETRKRREISDQNLKFSIETKVKEVERLFQVQETAERHLMQEIARKFFCLVEISYYVCMWQLW